MVLSPEIFARWEDIANACGFEVSLWADEDHPDRPAGLPPFRRTSGQEPVLGGVLHFSALKDDNSIYFVYRKEYDDNSLLSYGYSVYAPTDLEYWSKDVKKDKKFWLRWTQGKKLARYFKDCLTGSGGRNWGGKCIRYRFPRSISNWEALLALCGSDIEYQWPSFISGSTSCIQGKIRYNHAEIEFSAGPAMSTDGDFKWSFLVLSWISSGFFRRRRSKRLADMIDARCIESFQPIEKEYRR